ncbi:hypothetical protein OAH97_00385 [Octadecabacter sp.]|nr:hypothetical protein [Octadecabacter sp.]
MSAVGDVTHDPKDNRAVHIDEFDTGVIGRDLVHLRVVAKKRIRYDVNGIITFRSIGNH